MQPTASKLKPYEDLKAILMSSCCPVMMIAETWERPGRETHTNTPHPLDVSPDFVFRCSSSWSNFRAGLTRVDPGFDVLCMPALTELPKFLFIIYREDVNRTYQSFQDVWSIVQEKPVISWCRNRQNAKHSLPKPKTQSNTKSSKKLRVYFMHTPMVSWFC